MRKYILTLSVLVVISLIILPSRSVGHKIFYLCFPQYLKTPTKLYNQIFNLRNPSLEDYVLVQRYLENGKRPAIEDLQDYKRISKKFKIIGESPEQIPTYKKISVNCDNDNKENCILIYASYNRNYPNALKRLVQYLTQSDYSGHILYRIGGWPNVEGGDLTLAHVPYAFKACFFKEAQRLGYKKVLWLDTAITPLVPVKDFFTALESKGYLAFGNTHMVGPFFNERAAQGLGITLEESYKIPSCSAGIFGLDLTHPQSQKALQLWHAAAKDPHAYFSARPEQNALSVILYKLGMTDWEAYERIAECKEAILPTSSYLLDRPFSHTAPKS
jgi:hypothetical protein